MLLLCADAGLQPADLLYVSYANVAGGKPVGELAWNC